MEIKTGTTRRVFIFKNVVVKVARIKVLIVLRDAFLCRDIWQAIRKWGWRAYRGRVEEIKAARPAQKIEFEKYRLNKEKEFGFRVPVVKNYGQNGSNSMFLIAGIMANRQEWKFSRRNKNPFIMSTYFSLFGLFNVQKKGKEIDFWDDSGVWHYIHENSQNHNQPFCDGHALAAIENYCLDGQHLKMVDYGSRFLEPFLEANGKRLSQNFKLPCYGGSFKNRP